MSISIEVRNYMEVLVGNILAQDIYTEKYSSDQIADLACLALNQLRPVYIRHSIDFLSNLADERLLVFKQQAEIAVEAAETMIDDDRRSFRQNNEYRDIVISSDRVNDENAELEWFEQPIFFKK